MADPFTEYQKVLAERGLGSVFQEEGPGMAPSAETVSEQKRLQGTFSRGNYPEDLMNEAFIRNLDKDAKSKTIPSSGIEAALDEVRRAGFNSGLYGPKESLSFLEKKAQQESRNADASRIEAMPEDSLAFSDSPLDAIAAQIAKAQISNDPKVKPTDLSPEEKLMGMPVSVESEQAAPVIVDGDQAAEDMFKSSMDEFLNSARGASPDKRERTIENYKKEFADATGVDVSGKVDKSQALMAMGLALMQNRAGKGFNVGKLLNAVGQAGEKALPLLEKAKTKAQTAALAAGKYALESRGSDKAKDEATSKELRNRKKFWFYPKGSKGAEFEKFDQGSFEDLNAVEMDKLISNPDFASQYEFIDAADRFEILKTRSEGQDFGDVWGSEFEQVSLVGGDWKDQPAALVVNGVSANPNYGGTAPSKYKLGEDESALVNRFIGYQNGINKDRDRFEGLIANIEEGVSIPGQAYDKVTGFFRAIGYTPAGGMPSNTAQAKQALANFSIDNATDILKESGKTLSDGDRKLVSERVGKIDFFNSDPALILNQVRDIYNFTVVRAQNNLDSAIESLDKNFGISISPQQNDMPTQAELDAMNTANNTNLTLEDFR